jgi:purine-nucleoside phosphorylase
MENLVYDKLQKCLHCVRAKTGFKPQIALILGSGLGSFADTMTVEAAINYSEIAGFPVSTVPGHSGRFIFGYISSVPVVVMQGRVHYYEGYPMEDVVLPTRLMGMLGAKVLFLTNAVGAVNRTFTVGGFMVIRDQISCFVPSPLRGQNLDALGPRFPDMSSVYDAELRYVISTVAEKIGIHLYEGIYLQAPGPNFETPAEIQMYSVLGADVVGMSTACEATAAHHMGMRVCGISCISNMAAGISEKPLTHEEVQEAANKAAPQFKKLLTESISNIAQII